MKNPNNQYDHLYKPAKKWDVINDGDPDLKSVWFSLPSPPDIKLIDGYGLHPDEQYFHRTEVPKKLLELEDRALGLLYDIQKGNNQEAIQGYKLYLKYWDLFEAESEHLEKEIEWLRKTWWHRTEGYWFFNDGQPTFIPPEYYDYLNFYYIAESKTFPEYRDDIRRKNCFIWYLMNTTETFADIHPETGEALKVDGKYKMLDLGRRTFLGDIEPKTRRVGASHEGIHCLLVGAMTHASHYGTIISLEGQNAKALYEQKLLPAWDAYPMCLKPMWEGNRKPSVLKLSAPPNVYHIKGLNSSISVTESAGEKKSEGKRLNRILSDETGKTEAADAAERHHVNKLTMSTGMGINIIEAAYCKNPSTVDEMTAGGMAYYKLCMLSNFYKRVPALGQTPEGLARIFLPAYKRLEGYIDRFGMSVVDTPTERQKRLTPTSVFAMSGMGAREMLQQQRDTLLADGSPQAMEAYRSLRRKSPFTWAECWLGTSGNVGYNLEIIDKRLGEINRMKSFNKPPYKVGYYYREKGGQHDRVKWATDPQKPKFRVSMELPDAMTNRMTTMDIWDYSKGKFVPTYAPLEGYRFTIGADSFRNINKNDYKSFMKLGASASNSRQSDGGICMIWEYDESVDGGKPKRDWESGRVVLTYRWRPATWDEYVDDVVMAAQYWGAMIYPEYNVEAIVRDIYAKGYGGYFIYDLDIQTGKPKNMPGVYTSPAVLQEMITDTKDYIEFHGHKENHDDLLNEFKGLQGVESFTKMDLHVAFGMARKGSKSRHRDIMMQGEGDTMIIDGLF